MQDCHRAFTQSMMKEQFVKVEKAQDLKQQCCQQFPSQNQGRAPLEPFVQTINEALIPLDFAVRIITSHDTNQKYVVFVNNANDAFSKLATDFTATDILFIKKAIELIVYAPGDVFAMSENQLLNNAIDKKHTMTRKAAEILLNKLTERHWFLEENGMYSLGLRLIAELGHFLKESFGDVVLECPGCHESVLKGVSCANPDCTTRMHRRCSSILSKSQAPRCLNCRSEWIHS